MIIQPLVYTVRQVASMFQCSPATVHRQIRNGGIPAEAVVRYGKVVRIARWYVDEVTGRAA